MSEPALDTLDEWPWPRWEFVTAMPDEDGVTVALVPTYDSRRAHDGIGEGVCWFCAAGPCPGGCDIAGRLTDSTGAEASFDG